MLVCSVALRPKRGAIAATILERADALDTPALSVIFASISDNPGTASDTVSAFVGQNMVEAASAADVVSAGSIRNAAIVEETNALAVVRLPGPVAAAMTETAAADSIQDTAVAAIATLEGVFVDPEAPSTLIGADVIDSGPITIFE